MYLNNLLNLVSFFLVFSFKNVCANLMLEYPLRMKVDPIFP